MDKIHFTFHHIGCLTENIEESLRIYSNSLGFKKASAITAVSSQQVKVCFIEMNTGVNLELIEPTGDNKSLEKILKSKNPYYHIGYLVDDIAAAIEQLQQDGFHLVNRFHSEAFENRSCAFLYTTDMHLIELIER